VPSHFFDAPEAAYEVESLRPRERFGRLAAGAVAMLASRPAARPALTFFQLLLGPPNSPLPGSWLLGILNPADELVARQRRDVLPRIEGRDVGEQRSTQVWGQLVHNPTGNSLAAHSHIVVTGSGDPLVGPASETADASPRAGWCDSSRQPPGPGARPARASHIASEAQFQTPRSSICIGRSLREIRALSEP